MLSTAKHLATFSPGGLVQPDGCPVTGRGRLEARPVGQKPPRWGLCPPFGMFFRFLLDTSAKGGVYEPYRLN